MIELVRAVSCLDPGRPAVIVDGQQVTYAELTARAESYARGLCCAGIERFAVVSNDVAELAALLAAASLAGAEACLYRPDSRVGDVREQATAFDHRVLVTDRDDLGDVPMSARAPKELEESGDAGADPPERRPHLVLTTGTTGAPRGVRHDWSRLVARVAAAAGGGSGQRWLLAYGPQQFAGLQVLIHVFAAGATLVAPPERRPRPLLAAIRAHGVEFVSATPTFWRFLLAEMRADGLPVPTLRQITLGGEAAPPRLLEELALTFPTARISHVYAGSEFGSTSSVRDGRPGLPAALVHDAPGSPARLKIVDGELWARTGGGMLGYHGEADLAEDQWWHTGDSVEVDGDRIVFRGRRSEVINVGGVKVSPLPVEDRIDTVAGVRLARVHGRANPLVGAVVAVEVVPDGTVAEDVLAARIRAACAELPTAWRPRSIRFVSETAMAENKLVRGSREQEE